MMHETPLDESRSHTAPVVPSHLLRLQSRQLHSVTMSTQIQELIAAETKASTIVAEARACEPRTES